MLFSKTEEQCDCLVLERAADDPNVPVLFDSKMNEYHMVHADGQGHTIIRHCFFCGGKAPQSKREALFARVLHEELRRAGTVDASAQDGRRGVFRFRRTRPRL